MLIFILIILFIIHAVICVLAWLAKRSEESLALENLMPIVIAVPFFGAFAFALRYRMAKKARSKRREIGLEDFNVITGHYKRIEVDANANLEVVPLEEALAVNDSKTRHSLMLNILHGSPDEHIDMLQKARNSSDTEVTHYATTMMMEILTEYETNLQDYEKRHNEEKENGGEADNDLLKEYIEYLNRFIESGLVGGAIEREYRQRLAALCEEFEKSGESMGRLIFISIRNYLQLGDNGKAQGHLQRAAGEYRGDERVLLLYGQYFDGVHDYRAIQDMIAYIDENDIYLSREGREWVEFWRGRRESN